MKLDIKNEDKILLSFLLIFQFFMALPIFYGWGLIADNDFVANHSYVVIFKKFLLSGKGFWGWTPQFNAGTTPFLFNMPPFLYFLASLISLIGISTVTSLKLVLLFFFMILPIGFFFLAQIIFHHEKFSVYATTVLSCFFASELYGLPFFFSNGMANAAIGSSLLIFQWVFLFKVHQKFNQKNFFILIALNALSILNHLFSFYMFAFSVLLLCFFVFF